MQLKQYLVDARHLAGLVDSAGRQADGMSQSAPAGRSATATPPSSAAAPAAYAVVFTTNSSSCFLSRSISVSLSCACIPSFSIAPSTEALPHI